MFDYGRFSGWKYQVQTAAGVDLAASYAHTIFEEPSFIKFIPVAEARLGTSFTNARLGMYTCLGSFAPNANSALWGARVEKEKKEEKSELFVYWYPQLILQGYNATVEGGLFSKSDSSAALGITKRWVFEQALGVCYAAGRYTTKLAFIYQTREAVAQKNDQRYVSVQVGYRIH